MGFIKHIFTVSDMIVVSIVSYVLYPVYFHMTTGIEITNKF